MAVPLTIVMAIVVSPVIMMFLPLFIVLAGFLPFYIYPALLLDIVGTA